MNILGFVKIATGINNSTAIYLLVLAYRVSRVGSGELEDSERVMMDGEDLFLRRWLQTASELYDEITFNAPNDVYNYKAPDPWISFMIGAVSF